MCEVPNSMNRIDEPGPYEQDPHDYKGFPTIPDEEIIKDIADTQQEIDTYTKESRLLEHDKAANKARLYFLKGMILQRKEFIKKLRSILKDRETKSQKNQDQKWT